MRRYLPIAFYIPATAGAAVFVKVSFGEVSPFLITFATFLLCWILFLAVNVSRLSLLTDIIVRQPLVFVKLNAYTLLSWLGIFACIQTLSGSVELVVFMSVVPLFTVFAGGEWIRIGFNNRCGVVAICAIAMVIVFVHPQMRSYGIERQLLGLALGIGAGAFGALYIVLSGIFQKQQNLTANDLICLRLPLLIFATLLVSYKELLDVLSIDFLLKTSFLSFVAVIIPVYTLQRSITALGSIPTSILMPLVTVVALCFEWAGGLELSPIGVGAILLQCVAITYVTFSLASTRERLRRRDEATTEVSALPSMELKETT